MNPLLRFKAALELHGFQLRSDGRFNCPKHGGDSFSGRAEVGSGGKLLLVCHSQGCSARDIAESIGLTLQDLFPEQPRKAVRKSIEKIRIGGKEYTLHGTKKAAIQAAAFSVSKELQKSGFTFDSSADPEHTYDYSEAGKDLFSVLRWTLPIGKQIRQIRAVENGWIVAGPAGKNRPLYRVSESAEASDVVIVEGEKCVDALREAGFIALTSSGGSGNARLSDWGPLQGRRCLVLPDSDLPGERYAAEVLQQLRGVAASVRVVRLRDDCPELPAKSDSVEWLQSRQGESFEQLQARLAVLPDRTEEILAASGAAGVRGGGVDAESDEADGLPKISLGFDEARAAGDALKILAAFDPVFSDDTGLLKLSRTSGAMRAYRLSEPHVRELLSSICELHDLEREKQVRCPQWLSKSLVDRIGFEPVRRLRGIVRGPGLRPDGSIIRAPGYDLASELFCDYDFAEWPAIPERPDRTTAAAGLRKLWDLVSDFEFASEADRAAWVAAVLSVVARRCIAGPVPGIAFDAATRGSGKTLLSSLCAIVSTGEEISRSSWPADEAEAKKKLSSLLFQPTPKAVFLFDNVTVKLKGDSIESLLTSDQWADRLLGKSEVREVPANCVWIFSGNNIGFSSDLARRIVRCRLESSAENPEERANFRIHDIRKFAADNRPELLTGALVALSSFIRNGCPGADSLPNWGSFEAWGSIVRGCMVWCGLPDCAETRTGVRESADGDAEGLAAFVDAFGEIDPQGFGMSAEELLAYAADGDRFGGLRSGLESLTGRPVAELDSRRVGGALKKYRGRVVRGMKLEFRKSNGRRTWFLSGSQSFPESQGLSASQGFNFPFFAGEN